MNNPLMTLPIKTVLQAYAALSGNTGTVSKQAAADWLFQNGHQRAAIIQAAAAHGFAQAQPPRPTPAAAPAVDPQRLENLTQRIKDQAQGLDRLIDRCDALATEQRIQRDGLGNMARKAEAIEAAVTAQAAILGRLESTVSTLATQAKTPAPIVDAAQVQAAIVDEVRRAWVPFERAVQAANAQAQVSTLAAAKVAATLPALEVFGIEVKDRKGSPLMFDVYDDARAPAVDPAHLWSERMVRLVYQAQKHGARGNLWLGGLKGAGKTMTLQQFAARTGRAFTRINFHQHTAADEYLGATGLAQGSTHFQAADFLMAYQQPGHVICLDEITNAHPGSLAPLNGLLEPNARVSIGGQLWTRGPGVVVGACDNTNGSGDATGRHAGTREMNSALMDRFPFKAWVEFLPRDLERKALMSRTGASDRLVDHVLDAVDACRAKVQTGEIIDPPSIRAVEAFLLMLETEDTRDAWNMTIAAAQPAESAVGLEAVYTACISPAYITKHL